MSENYLGELRIFPFGFAPKGWAQCNGQLLPINQNQALFALLGTTYGGNGQVNFALPNLQGRVPVHVGNGINLGQSAGEQAHTLTVAEMPGHTHPLSAKNASATADSSGTTPDATKSLAQGLASSTPTNVPVSLYGTGGPSVTMNAASVSSFGGSQAHTNMQPYTVLNVCIALVGIFPSQN